MNITIENETVNRLLHRTDIRCLIETGGITPSRRELISQIAAKKGVDENLVVVDKIEQEYGKKSASAYVKIYESEKAARAIELKHKVERSKKAPKEKKEDAPAGEKEAAPEEKKDEAPVEKGGAAPEKKKEDAPAEKKKEGED